MTATILSIGLTSILGQEASAAIKCDSSGCKGGEGAKGGGAGGNMDDGNSEDGFSQQGGHGGSGGGSGGRESCQLDEAGSFICERVGSITK